MVGGPCVRSSTTLTLFSAVGRTGLAWAARRQQQVPEAVRRDAPAPILARAGQRRGRRPDRPARTRRAGSGGPVRRIYGKPPFAWHVSLRGGLGCGAAGRDGCWSSASASRSGHRSRRPSRSSARSPCTTSSRAKRCPRTFTFTSTRPRPSASWPSTMLAWKMRPAPCRRCSRSAAAPRHWRTATHTTASTRSSYTDPGCCIVLPGQGAERQHLSGAADRQGARRRCQPRLRQVTQSVDLRDRGMRPAGS